MEQGRKREEMKAEKRLRARCCRALGAIVRFQLFIKEKWQATAAVLNIRNTSKSSMTELF